VFLSAHGVASVLIEMVVSWLHRCPQNCATLVNEVYGTEAFAGE
jgi:hypothetical protein